MRRRPRCRICVSCRWPTISSSAKAAWSRRSMRSAPASAPTKACRSGSTSSDMDLTPIEIGLTTAIVAVNKDEPRVLVAESEKKDNPAGLPSGPFDPLAHRTFEIGLRAWVQAQTAIDVAYVEQLYTFG